jgi:hypothetical protein
MAAAAPVVLGEEDGGAVGERLPQGEMHGMGRRPRIGDREIAAPPMAVWISEARVSEWSGKTRDFWGDFWIKQMPPLWVGKETNRISAWRKNGSEVPAPPEQFPNQELWLMDAETSKRSWI